MKNSATLGVMLSYVYANIKSELVGGVMYSWFTP